MLDFTLQWGPTESARSTVHVWTGRHAVLQPAHYSGPAQESHSLEFVLQRLTRTKSFGGVSDTVRLCGDNLTPQTGPGLH